MISQAILNLRIDHSITNAFVGADRNAFLWFPPGIIADIRRRMETHARWSVSKVAEPDAVAAEPGGVRDASHHAAVAASGQVGDRNGRRKSRVSVADRTLVECVKLSDGASANDSTKAASTQQQRQHQQQQRVVDEDEDEDDDDANCAEGRVILSLHDVHYKRVMWDHFAMLGAKSNGAEEARVGRVVFDILKGGRRGRRGGKFYRRRGHSGRGDRLEELGDDAALASEFSFGRIVSVFLAFIALFREMLRTRFEVFFDH